MNSKVSLVRSENSFDGVMASLKPLEKEIRAKLQKTKKPIIKVNFVTCYEELAATPIEAIRALLTFLKPIYKNQIKIVEGAALGETLTGFKNYNYLPLEKEFNVKFIDLNQDDAEPVIMFNQKGQTFQTLMAKTVIDSDFIISLCRPKTHDTVVVTLTLKNLIVGSLIQKSKIHQGRMIHQNLCQLSKIVKPDLAILDGTLGMQGNGPIGGQEIKAGWVLSGLDFLSVDTLGAYLMGFNLSDIGYLKLCQKEDLGQAYPDDKIEIIGEKPESLRINFKPHSTYNYQIRWQENLNLSQEAVIKFHKAVELIKSKIY